METQQKKKVDKTCRMCYHCRVKIGINLNNILATIVTPENRKEGLIAIYCRKGWWGRDINIPPILFNINAVNRLEVLCPHFKGEDDEEDNSALEL